LFVVLVSLTPASFAVRASPALVPFAARVIALALAGKMVVEAEFPARVPRVAPDACRPMMR
jgi:hypothetical protein